MPRGGPQIVRELGSSLQLCTATAHTCTEVLDGTGHKDDLGTQGKVKWSTYVEAGICLYTYTNGILLYRASSLSSTFTSANNVSTTHLQQVL